MAIKIVTGGTTGAQDGTLVSVSNRLTFTSTAAIDAHIRCDDGYWSNDQLFDLLPDTIEVSFDGGSTWYGPEDEPITAPEIYAVNYPVKFRQLVAVDPGATASSFDTDGTYTAIAALSTPTLTATAVGDSQIDLSWTNVANEDASPGYTVERSLDGSSWSALTTKAADVTTHSDTGLTESTHYYYRVKAEGSGRYSDSGWGTDDDTTTADETFSETFSSGSVPNSSRFGTATGGSGAVSVTGGVALMDVGSSSDAALMYVKPKIPTSLYRKYRARVRNPNASWSGTVGDFMNLRTDGNVPASITSGSELAIRATFIDNGSSKGISVYYWNDSNAAQSCQSSGVWHAYSGTDVTFPITGMVITDWVEVELEWDGPNSRWRVNAWDKDGTSLGSTDWVTASDLRGDANDKYVIYGDNYTNFLAADTEVDSVTVASS